MLGWSCPRAAPAAAGKARGVPGGAALQVRIDTTGPDYIPWEDINGIDEVCVPQGN
jgi:hypothetical protein